jgi:hypothetical protein
VRVPLLDRPLKSADDDNQLLLGDARPETPPVPTPLDQAATAVETYRLGHRLMMRLVTVWSITKTTPSPISVAVIGRIVYIQHRRQHDGGRLTTAVSPRVS